MDEHYTKTKCLICGYGDVARDRHYYGVLFTLEMSDEHGHLATFRVHARCLKSDGVSLASNMAVEIGLKEREI